MSEWPGGSLERRRDAVSMDYQTAFALGPVASGDTSQGLVNFVWRARISGQDVLISRQNTAGDGWEPESVLFTFTGSINEISLAFEQNGRAVIAAERPGLDPGATDVWVYWYDPLLPGFTFQNFGAGRTPRALLDNPLDSTISDIQIFYMSDVLDALAHRQQRDRYATEYTTPLVGISNMCIEAAFRGGNRVHVLYSVRDVVAGTWSYRRLSTAAYDFLFFEEAEVSFSTLDPVLVDAVIERSVVREDVNATFRSLNINLAIIQLLHDTPESTSIGTEGSIVSGSMPLVVIEETLGTDSADVTYATLAPLLEDAVFERTQAVENVDVTFATLSPTLEVV